jgi:hypothetical protein
VKVIGPAAAAVAEIGLPIVEQLEFVSGCVASVGSVTVAPTWIRMRFGVYVKPVVVTVTVDIAVSSWIAVVPA